MKITVKELNNGYKYITTDKMSCLYKESNIYRTFGKLSDAKKLFLKLIN